ncbi:hypothetical protein [Sporosarcina sp. UB5]|uniref:hypothetical protein n=1 Tax=Sporosarcina sp. UB5 TaxID=3047463 RepID=UPI003D7999D0
MKKVLSIIYNHKCSPVKKCSIIGVRMFVGKGEVVLEEKLNLILQELQHMNNKMGKFEEGQTNLHEEMTQSFKEVKNCLLNLQKDGELIYQKIALLELRLNRLSTKPID